VQLIVVGAGGVTRDLLRGLSEAWQVTVVDTDPRKLEQLEGVRARGETRFEPGDGTSRIVLERAGLDRADGVVAAIGDDRANLEVCRIAKGAGVARIAAVAAGPESINAYRSEEFVAFSPASLTARRLEIQLEPRRVASAPIAEGMAQAIEFRIAADSPLLGRMLRDLDLERTLIAAISRRGTLIVPHGATVLEEGDLVTVVCATADYPMVARAFTSATARFPADLGGLVAVRLHDPEDLERLLPAAIGIVRNSAAEGLLLLHRPMAHPASPSAAQAGGAHTAVEDDDGDGAGQASHPDSAADRETRSLIEAARERAEGITVTEVEVESGSAEALVEAARASHAGVAVLPTPGGRFATVGLLHAALDQQVAVLLPAGAASAYPAILAPARETPAGRAASQAAIDLAVNGSAQLTGVAIRPPAFMAGPEARQAAVGALGRLRDAASVQGIHLRRMVREGNPIRILRAEGASADLLVLGLPVSRPHVWAPGIVGHLVLRPPCSLLLVPRPPASRGNGAPSAILAGPGSASGPGSGSGSRS